MYEGRLAVTARVVNRSVETIKTIQKGRRLGKPTISGIIMLVQFVRAEI